MIATNAHYAAKGELQRHPHLLVALGQLAVRRDRRLCSTVSSESTASCKKMTWSLHAAVAEAAHQFDSISMTC